jgi:ABC-type nitrate/sulfonate/bicarbonate transport system substrate-binding protein
VLNRAIHVRLFAASLLLSLAALPALAQPTPANIRLGTFGQSLNLLVAERQGYFAEQNLNVQVLAVTSSTQQFQFLRDNRYDLIATSPDNVVNYRLNPNNALGALLNVKIIAGTNYSGNQALYGQWNITSLEAFRGKNLVVDSAVSGFAFVAYQMLRNAGLERGRDYTVLPCGGGTQRLIAMLAGRCGNTLVSGGALLNDSNAAVADETGYTRVQKLADLAGANPYLSSIIAAKEEWLAANEDVAVRFTAALLKATRFILNPANQAEVTALIASLPNTTQAYAQQAYLTTLTPKVGLIPELEIDPIGLRAVLQLRQDFDGFETPQDIDRLVTPAGGLFDPSYISKAKRLLGE